MQDQSCTVALIAGFILAIGSAFACAKLRLFTKH